MQDAIVARNCFIVEINLSKDNDVEIVIESEDGTVSLDDCVELSRIFEEKFDREQEDYSLTVGSAGLDQPFKVLKQYVKAAGTEVQVLLKDGRKLKGKLTASDDDSFTIEIQKKVKPEGAKRPVIIDEPLSFGYDEIKYTKYLIDF